MKIMRALWLFVRIVWREWEPAKSCGIPEQFRIHYRLTIADAWRLARAVWK